MTRKPEEKTAAKKIAKIIRERVLGGGLVPLSAIKDLKSKKKKATVLIVEDDESVQRALLRILALDGHNIISASDGSELSQLLEKNSVDLIMLDVGLPWIDGFELAEIMQADLELKKIPIVFISGQNDISSIKKGFGVGAHDFIKKPFEVEKIRKTVNTLLELSS